MFGYFTALHSATKVLRIRQVAIALASVVLFGGIFAQAADKPVKAPLPNDVGIIEWGGLNWGIGIAIDFDVGGKRVGQVTAIPPDNIVRVGSTSGNANVGFVLEAHYFLLDFVGKDFMKSAMCSGKLVYGCATEIGFGPFVAIEIGNGAEAPTTASKGPVTGYALGLMVGLHHLDSPNPHSSWNFGVGLRVDPGATVLGDGIVANQPLPFGESATNIRTKTEPRLGIMLLSSFSF